MKNYIRSAQKLLQAKQLYRGKIDGLVGQKSLSAAVYALKGKGDFSSFDKFKTVLAAGQAILNDLGYGAGVLDGIWGPNTNAAFSEWEKKQPVVLGNTGLRRIVMHWTAGTHSMSDIDKKHYHFVIDGNGNVVACDHVPEDNIAPVRGQYAAHTLNLNSGSIGVSLCAMSGAKERPFNAGKYPVTEEQVEALVKLVAELCRKYGIEVSRETVLSHAEVQPTLGVKQRGKWDFTWLPGVDAKGAVAVGDVVRERILEALA